MNSEELADPSADATLISVPNAMAANFSLDELGLAPLSIRTVSGPVSAESSSAPAVFNSLANRIENETFLVENIEITHLVENSIQTNDGKWIAMPDVQTEPLDLSLNSVLAQNPGTSLAAVVVPVGIKAKKGERFKSEETIALLKSMAWMGLLRQENDGLPLNKMRRVMVGDKYWVENYKGRESLGQRFYATVGIQGKKRSLDSLKRKWKGEVLVTAKIPKKYFEQHAGILDAERIFWSVWFRNIASKLFKMRCLARM